MSVWAAQRRVPATEQAVSDLPRCSLFFTHRARSFVITVLMLQPPSNLDSLNQLLPSLDRESLLLGQCAFFGSRSRFPISLSRKRVRRVVAGSRCLAYLHQSLFLALCNHDTRYYGNGPLLLELKAGL